MPKKTEIDSSPNSETVNRPKSKLAGSSARVDGGSAPVQADLPNGELPKVDQPKEETPMEEKPQIKSGGWFAKPPVRKNYIPPAPTSFPMKIPKDYHQTWALDTTNGEGVVYTIDLTHPDINEAKTYVVHPDVIAKAVQQCSEGNYTFSILTDKNDGVGGEVRLLELHPWVTKTGQFGLMPILKPLLGNTLSETAYDNKTNNLTENQGKWVRRTTIEKSMCVFSAVGAELLERARQ
jgi:hypothetical protein